MEATWSQQDPDFLRLFSAGLGKWLLHLLGQSAPQRQLSLLSSYYYQVGPDGPDMLSLVFRCETAPQTVSDQHGILLPGPVAAPVSEVELGIDLARVLQGSSDLDLLLAENQELAEKRLKQAKTLLETARFSADAYEAWGREELRKKRVALGLEQVDA